MYIKNIILEMKNGVGIVLHKGRKHVGIGMMSFIIVLNGLAYLSRGGVATLRDMPTPLLKQSPSIVD